MLKVWTSIFTATPTSFLGQKELNVRARKVGTHGRTGARCTESCIRRPSASPGVPQRLEALSEKNRRTMEHEHPHHNPSTHTIFHGLPNKSWLLLGVIFSFHCLGYSWRHSISTSRKYKTLTMRLKKTVSWRAKTLTMSAPDFMPALVEPEHFSHLGTVWKFVVDQSTIGLRCSQNTQTVEIDISTLGCKGNRVHAETVGLFVTHKYAMKSPTIYSYLFYSMVLNNSLQVPEV